MWKMWYREHLKSRYGVYSASEFDEKQLRQVYQAVAYRVKKAKSSS